MDGRKLNIKGSLNQPEYNTLEVIIKRFIANYGNLLVVNANIKTPMAALPFKIKAALGGDSQFIVTGDGLKVSAGGSIMGYQLILVDDQKIIFSGPEEVVIER